MGPLSPSHHNYRLRWYRRNVSLRLTRAGTLSSFACLATLILPFLCASGQSRTSSGSSSGNSGTYGNSGNSGTYTNQNTTGNRGNTDNTGGNPDGIGPPPTAFWWPDPQLHPECSLNSGDYERRMGKLDKDGPQMPPLYVWNGPSFSIMGFANGNWPIFIDYVLEQAGILLVVVAPDGEQPATFFFNSKDGHHNMRFDLPAGMGNQLRVSEYLVQPVGTARGLHVLGISAGPKAVGSMGIDQVAFGPKSIQLAQHQKAEYTFHSIKDFKKTSVTFIRLAPSKDGIIAADVGDKNIGSINQNGQKKGDWDGTPKLPKELVKQYPPELQKWLLIPTGLHALQVRAWFGVADGGDWVTALSDTQVAVQ